MRLALLTLSLLACSETGVTPDVDRSGLTSDTDPDGGVDDVEVDPRAPVSDAGEPFEAVPLREVQLDGTRSYDPQGRPLIPTWRLLSVPKGSRARIDRADTLQPLFFADVAGDYEIELGVRNDLGLVDETPDRVMVHVVPASSVYVQLTWDAAVDLDLHLTPDSDPMWSRTDCTWCNLSPQWGLSGTDLDDPSLDIDAIEGFGPETITIEVPSDGRITAHVDYYGQGGDIGCPMDCPDTEATIDVYIDGQHVHRSRRVLTTAGSVWKALSIDWPSGEIEVHDTIGWTGLEDCQ